MDTKGLKLTSAAPLEDKLKKFNLVYIIGFAIGCIYGIIVDTPNWFVTGAIFIIPAWLVKYVIAMALDVGLQKTVFNANRSFTGKEVAGLISIPLTQMGMTVSIESEKAVVTFNGMRYTIRSYSDNTFGLTFNQTASSGLLGGFRPILQYKKAIVAMSLIAFTVQSEISKAKSAWS